MMLCKKITRMSRDNQRLTRQKVVILVNCLLASEVTRLRIEA